MTRAILFDVDGTLLDTNYFHVLAWLRACRSQGVGVSASWLHHRIGMGSDKIIRELTGGESQELNEAHTREYAPFRPEERAFESVPELLRQVAGAGVAVWLATSAKKEELATMRKAIGAEDAITGVVSSGEVSRSKPDPDIFELALSRAGSSAREAMVVGDTVWDVEAARAAGLECVCVETGGIGRALLLEAGAAAVYADPAELRRSLAESPLARVLGRD